MISSDKIAALQQQLDALARVPDPDLDGRYVMQRPPRPAGLYWQSRWLAGRMLRWLQSTGLLGSRTWPVSLVHARTGRRANPVLVWGVDVARDDLRRACDACAHLLRSMPGVAPVLVTDQADFSYYSRLRWLVEYLPRIDGHDDDYAVRKAQFLARLYRGAPALPAGYFLEPDCPEREVRSWIERFSS